MIVKDVMTTQVITVKEAQTRQQVAHLLTQHRISGVPVVKNGNVVVGVVTEYDIIAKEGLRVRDIMTRSVISVSEDTDLEEVSRIFVHEHIKRLLVLDHGKLVGIVSRADLIKQVAMRWVCPICGELIHSQVPPECCPRCGAARIGALAEAISPGS
jgi:CBS domain-containing protein